MKPSRQAELKEAKEVMEDEGGANQAGMKKQEGKPTGKPTQNDTDTYDHPGENAQANEPTGRTGPIDPKK